MNIFIHRSVSDMTLGKLWQMLTEKFFPPNIDFDTSEDNLANDGPLSPLNQQADN